MAKPVISANIGFLFAEHPMIERFKAAADAGFSVVEAHWLYDIDLSALKSAVAEAGVSVLGINTSMGDTSKGERGLAGVPGREADFRRHFDEALTYAKALGAKAIHVMAGTVPPEQRQAGFATYVRNLRAVAPEAASAGITLLLEPLNTRDAPGYLVSTSDDAVAIVREIAAPNVKIMFDVYHVQIMEGDLLKRLERHWPHIGHVQVASVPGRNEPDEGEVDYRAIFAAFDRLGWTAPIGAEYKPRAGTVAGLGWMRALGVA